MEAKIIEGNKMIAEFMNYEKYQFRDYTIYIFEENNHRTMIDLHYHSSWEWLMPVVMEIGNRAGYTLVMEENASYWCNEGQHDELPQFGGYSNIENIWEAVIEFIKWHNK